MVIAWRRKHGLELYQQLPENGRSSLQRHGTYCLELHCAAVITDIPNPKGQKIPFLTLLSIAITKTPLRPVNPKATTPEHHLIITHPSLSIDFSHHPPHPSLSHKVQVKSVSCNHSSSLRIPRRISSLLAIFSFACSSVSGSDRLAKIPVPRAYAFEALVPILMLQHQTYQYETIEGWDMRGDIGLRCMSIC